MTTSDHTPTVTTQAVRAVLRRALRDMLVLVAVVAVGGSVVGWLLEGTPGVWGALIGAGVALVFSGTTVLSMLRTADAPAATTGIVVLGAWLLKMILLVVLLAVLDGMTFYDREVLVVVVLVAVLGSVYVDYRAVATGRVPYVEPSAADARPDAGEAR
ncbi:hypothetical protein [Actinotalea sp. Marseille-Q4924]|uniref:hypothetical protein n=1 Tax=Actinotalea sp. Marseille-Q4924 TaxID=2866571 RepID=UPI001CE3D2D2|nr:hypothetical protein [Actinotalea sp. Marseille-Q4924]